jgi:hypothetical protein
MTIEITYAANGVTQTKEVIPHDTFLSVIKPSKERLYLLEGELSNKQLKLTEAERLSRKAEIETLRQTLAPFASPFCTDQSPIYMALGTGILSLPENQGGDHKVSISVISN